MSDTPEWSQERRDLIDLVDDIASRLRRCEDKGYIVMLLEQAASECEGMDSNL